MKARRMSEQELTAHQIRMGKARGPFSLKREPEKIAAPKRAKHGNVKIEIFGLKFDSKHEFSCYRTLKLREAAMDVRNIRHHVKFSLFCPGGEHYGVYTADFVFEEREIGTYDWRRVVADAKSKWTKKLPAWQKVKKLMMACHGIEVVEL